MLFAEILFKSKDKRRGQRHDEHPSSEKYQ